VKELRQLVAGTIQKRPDTYSEAVLEQKRDTYPAATVSCPPPAAAAYCEWIKMESSWGGGIELGIFADQFETEVGGAKEQEGWERGWLGNPQIVTIDVATGNVIRLNKGTDTRVIVVYSGIHYDARELRRASALVNNLENDKIQFDRNDNESLATSQQLCVKIRQKSYYTDMKNITLKCKVCQKLLKGEKEAVARAAVTTQLCIFLPPLCPLLRCVIGPPRSHHSKSFQESIQVNLKPRRLQNKIITTWKVEKSHFKEKNAAIKLQPSTMAECIQESPKGATLIIDGRGGVVKSPTKCATKCHATLIRRHFNALRGPPVYTAPKLRTKG
jgi:tRNA(Leu) C34 or U34 (ribose-2'-O)-methylase TrmL